MNSGIPSEILIGSLAEAQRRLGEPTSGDPAEGPAVARRLRQAGARSVCLTEVDPGHGRARIWVDTEHATGWLTSAAVAAPLPDDWRMRFNQQLLSATARGFVAADAAVLALMASSGAAAEPGFVNDPDRLPTFSWGETPESATASLPHPAPTRSLDLYAIVDSAERVGLVLAAGIATVQLRIKTPAVADAAWQQWLRLEIERSVAACQAARAELFINDHWQLAAQCGASGVPLGQEDLLALGDDGRTTLRATGMALGISSHSLWELCRGRALQPRYIACGPVWPTLAKAMPWRAQGLDNLAWWCRMAGAPVVAIGGVLGPQQVLEAARAGADGVCIVRGLGDRPQVVVPALQAALVSGRTSAGRGASEPLWPHPSLDPHESLPAG
ncbi:MAG: thiamine phosphate synthase [Microbacteriaceae bacterium]|nr:thiamine phosphate synthase [Burkholderiaceae bacterium]